MTSYTINTAKGSHTTHNLRAVCAWQAKMQGAFASIEATLNGKTYSADVDSVDFDGDQLTKSVRAVESLLGAELADETIEALQTEAGAAGDTDMVTLCASVLAGHSEGLGRVWRALDDAAAQS